MHWSDHKRHGQKQQPRAQGSVRKGGSKAKAATPAHHMAAAAAAGASKTSKEMKQSKVVVVKRKWPAQKALGKPSSGSTESQAAAAPLLAEQQPPTQHRKLLHGPGGCGAWVADSKCALLRWVQFPGRFSVPVHGLQVALFLQVLLWVAAKPQRQQQVARRLAG